MTGGWDSRCRARSPARQWARSWRELLWLLAFVFVAASIGCALAPNWYALVFFRWLGGVGVGAASVGCPMYITEIAPPKKRGLLVAVSQLNIVIGILMAYFSNWLVSRALGDANPDL